jgi:endoglucanase
MNTVLLFAACLLPLGSALAHPASDSIAASQLGYAPAMKKEFSSTVSFGSFDIRRVSDDSSVFTGGAPLRQVTSSLIGGAPVWIGDFSPLSVSGRYKIVVGTSESFPFTIGSGVYDQPLRVVQRFFYYQRAFTGITMPFAEGPWTHASDLNKAPPGVVKGWHDAGDYAIYMPTMTQAIFWMLEAWSDFLPPEDGTNIPESGNGIPDLLDEARWGLEWVRSMQDSSGGFWGAACPGCDNYSYGYGVSLPTDPGVYCMAIPATVQNTAKAVAVLAYASSVYARFDGAFALACLASAQSGWQWMRNNAGATNDAGPCNSYQQGSNAALLRTNRMWAAAALLYATGDSAYETAFQRDYVAVDGISSFDKTDAFAASLYLRTSVGANPVTQEAMKQQILTLADGVRADADAHPYQFATAYYWGCTSNGMHRSGQFSWRAYGLDSTRVADRDQGLMNLDYIFGRNFYHLCYVSGIDGVTNGRLRGFHHWMKALNTFPWHFPGALSSGPNQAPEANDISYPNAQPYPIWGYWGDPENPRGSSTPVDGRFTDNDSWSTNEVAINWNAALLYNLYAARAVARKGNPNSVPAAARALPLKFELHQNFPNPFNGSTLIDYELPVGAEVEIVLFDGLGKRIRTLVRGYHGAGTFRLGVDAAGLSSGTYYYRLTAGSRSETRQFQLLK